MEGAGNGAFSFPALKTRERPCDHNATTRREILSRRTTFTAGRCDPSRALACAAMRPYIAHPGATGAILDVRLALANARVGGERRVLLQDELLALRCADRCPLSRSAEHLAPARS
jgi:hypothetical protein